MADNPTFELDVGSAQQRRQPSNNDVEANPKLDDEHRDGRLSDLLYGVDDTPPWYLCVFLGFQHYLTMFGSTMTIPLLLTPAMCVSDDEAGQVTKSEIISTMFFVGGLVTLLQATFGTRLPIVQGGAFAFLAPAFAILSLPKWKCPNAGGGGGQCIGSSTPLVSSNVTDSPTSTASFGVTSDAPEVDNTEIWQLRMREIQGAIIISSLFEVFIGLSGAVGFMMKFIGPLAVAPTVALVGLSLFGAASNYCGHHWWIAIMTMAFVALFSQYLRNVTIPCCSLTTGTGSSSRTGFPMFKLFPIILAFLLAWLVCAILTWTDVLTDDPCKWGYKARTDTRTSVMENAKWFRFPYPLQWGTPTFSLGAIFGMLAGVLAGIVESIGDYYACARLAGAPPPPVHAVNRGIFIEGIGCVLAGLWGTGDGTTSYSQNVGAIGITKVGSRRVVQTSGLIMLALALLGKFGALFVTIPDPVVGGVLMVMFGMICAVGISNLQFVDLNSSRNLFIIGFSIFFGLSFPQWVKAHPGKIEVGVTELDQIFTVLLSTNMFVGGAVAFILDNTIPGTPEERGLAKWRQVVTGGGGATSTESGSLRTYDLPFGMEVLRRMNWTRYVPVCPTFGSERSTKLYSLND